MSFDSQLSCGIVNTSAKVVNTCHLLCHSISVDLMPSVDLRAKHCTNFNMDTK